MSVSGQTGAEVSQRPLGVGSHGHRAPCPSGAAPGAPLSSFLSLQPELPAGSRRRACQPQPGPRRQLQLPEVPLPEPELHESGQHAEPGQLCEPGGGSSAPSPPGLVCRAVSPQRLSWGGAGGCAVASH